jgi:hypothetical protein
VAWSAATSLDEAQVSAGAGPAPAPPARSAAVRVRRGTGTPSAQRPAPPTVTELPANAVATATVAPGHQRHHGIGVLAGQPGTGAWPVTRPAARAAARLDTARSRAVRAAAGRAAACVPRARGGAVAGVCQEVRPHPVVGPGAEPEQQHQRRPVARRPCGPGPRPAVARRARACRGAGRRR